MEALQIIKFPCTPHLEGSRLQPGDEDLSQVPFSKIAGRNLVVEEKCDGANSAISFSDSGEMLLQSRGHYLTGGYRERHYNLMKLWAGIHQEAFYRILGKRYIMYGEWMYAKHTVFYDALPHYFLEFDILDRESGHFLDTDSRYRLLEDLPVVSVPVLAKGCFTNKKDLLNLLGASKFITAKHIECLKTVCKGIGLEAAIQCGETDSSNFMEGLYLKVEEEGRVKERLKFVRASFAQCVNTSDTHWLDRPIVPNQLSIPIECIFEEQLPGNNHTMR